MSETCQKCGKDYDYIWSAPDSLWNLITGDGPHDGGLYCIPCFDGLAQEAGLDRLYWSFSESDWKIKKDKKK